MPGWKRKGWPTMYETVSSRVAGGTVPAAAEIDNVTFDVARSGRGLLWVSASARQADADSAKLTADVDMAAGSIALAVEGRVEIDDAFLARLPAGSADIELPKRILTAAGATEDDEASIGDLRELWWKRPGDIGTAKKRSAKLSRAGGTNWCWLPRPARRTPREC